MKRIILRSDDLGYSEAVNYGMAKACDNGLPMSIGIMTNMEAAAHGCSLIQNKDYCLGIHTNITVGNPVSDPGEIPSLVNKDGSFHSSKEYRSASADIADVKDVETEAEAQYRKFVELTGREPDYFDIHAVASMAFMQGVNNVAQRHGIPCSLLPVGTDTMYVADTETAIQINGSGDQSVFEIIDEFMGSECETMILVFHPGYHCT